MTTPCTTWFAPLDEPGQRWNQRRMDDFLPLNAHIEREEFELLQEGTI